jgi:hypothetical protein
MRDRHSSLCSPSFPLPFPSSDVSLLCVDLIVVQPLYQLRSPPQRYYHRMIRVTALFRVLLLPLSQTMRGVTNLSRYPQPHSLRWLEAVCSIPWAIESLRTTVPLVRCAFSDRILHSRMPLDPTHVRFSTLEANMCDQWHSSRESIALTIVTINYAQTLKVNGTTASSPSSTSRATRTQSNMMMETTKVMCQLVE